MFRDRLSRSEWLALTGTALNGLVCGVSAALLTWLFDLVRSAF